MVCIKHALVRWVTQVIMVFLPFPSIQVFKSGMKMGIGRVVPHLSETKLQHPMRRISRVLPTALQVLGPQPGWQNRQHVLAGPAISMANRAPSASFAAAAGQAAGQEKLCAHQSRIQQGSGAHATVWEGEGSRFQPMQCIRAQKLWTNF